MDSIEKKIRDLQIHAREQVKLIETNNAPEEDTKTALIQPFINDVLSYHIKNLSEVKTEFNIDYGCLKVDYVILKDGVPIILIECKKCTDVLDKKYLNQLKTYYPLIKGAKSKFGILTNGIRYQFYADTRNTNILDDDPFFEFDLLNMPDSAITELEKFIKSADIDNARDRADELMKMKDIRAIIEGLFKAPPSEDFVRFIAKQDHVKFVNDNVIKEYSELATAVINQYVLDRIGNGKKTETPIDPEGPKNGPWFVFKGQTYKIKRWKDMLPKVCSIMLELGHKDEFEKVLEIKGPKHKYFSKNPDEFKKYGEKIEGTDIFVNTNIGPWDNWSRSKKVIAKFGYPEDDLKVKKFEK